MTDRQTDRQTVRQKDRQMDRLRLIAYKAHIIMFCCHRVFTTVLTALGTSFSPTRSPTVLPEDVKNVRY